MLKDLQSESFQGKVSENLPIVALKRKMQQCAWVPHSPKIRGQLGQPHKIVLVPNLPLRVGHRGGDTVCVGESD